MTPSQRNRVLNRIAGLTLAGGLLMAALPAIAQTDGPSTPFIASQGSASLELPPQRLRVWVRIVARGADNAQALEQLKTQKQMIVDALEDLGAEAESVRFTQPSKAAGGDQEMEQYLNMMREQLGRRFEQFQEKLTANTSLGCICMADWLLPEGTNEERLLASIELEEKIREAKLADLGADAAANEAEAEMRAEIEMMFQGRGPRQGQGKDNSTRFALVARPTDEQLKQVAAKAVARARTDAQRFAEASGSQLGPLMRLMKQDQAELYGRYNHYGYSEESAAQMTRQVAIDVGDQQERFAQEPGTPIVLTIDVQAAFALE